MKKLFFIHLFLFFSLQIVAQTTIKGVVRDAETQKPLENVKISFLKQEITTKSNAVGEFFVHKKLVGEDEITLTLPGYFIQTKVVKVKDTTEDDLGEFQLIKNFFTKKESEYSFETSPLKPEKVELKEDLTYTKKEEKPQSYEVSKKDKVSTPIEFDLSKVKGVIRDAGTKQPLANVNITLLQQRTTTKSNALGEFFFENIPAGKEEISFSLSGYFPQIKTINVNKNSATELGVLNLTQDFLDEEKNETVLELNDSQLDDEGGSQSPVAALSSNTDIYIGQTGYSFSPMRFRTRGYENKYESTSINGIRFYDSERGGFNFSSLGGLNNAMRNKDLHYGINPNNFSYGNLGSNTNINTRASSFASGTHVNAAFSNRSYLLRGQVIHATGVLPSGWAFAASGVVRWANEGIVDGTFYNSAGYFFSAEKIFNNKHSLSFVSFGAPTHRAQQSANTKEVVDLKGSIYYNSYWGYQDGKKRNSRVVKAFDPTAILSHEWKITANQKLTTGIAFHYSKYSGSAFVYANAPNPSPDYYRNMPSFSNDDISKKEIREEWQNNSQVSQINWNAIYLANYKNNEANPGGQLKYGLERRHNDLMETALSSTYFNQINRNLKLRAGVDGKFSKGMHYKTLDDLLGGKQLIDVDTYAERDFPDNKDIVQNNLKNPNAIIKEGDVFGYNYDINVVNASAFTLGELNFRKFDFYLGAQVSYNQFHRIGHMQNGRAPKNSFGKGKTWFFLDPSVKLGTTYKLTERNLFSLNVLAETRPPLIRDAFVSERTKDNIVPNIKTEKILSYDLNYSFSFLFMRGRLSAFRTHVLASSRKLGYYDDELRTFVNHTLTDADKIFQGIEMGIFIPINTSFNLSAAGTFADYSYTSNANSVKSVENGSKEDRKEIVLTKGLKINNGPQLAANASLNYFHRKMWFATLTLSYFDRNYLDFAPNRFTESNVKKYKTEEMVKALGTQEKLKGGFLLDASLGKMIYMKKGRSLNFNLSASNLLNNTSMVTGGYQQARLPLDNDKEIVAKNLNHFPNKYYHAWGINFFLHVGYKF